ncbi:conserved protein of unknown function [Tenacibaculum sp. 190130A14a]|uniref:Uncharacterized protein n=1 Tax=Tenacibaculum polynesiense TaxID=3137857 RepID=A0ABP1EYN8_9FLAO
MDHINRIIKKAQDDLFPQLEAKIRAELATKDKDWLIEQIIFLTCERHSLHEQNHRFNNLRERINRIRKTDYTTHFFNTFIQHYQHVTREQLESENYLINPSHMGLEIITPNQRTPKGNILLEKARDLLYVCLYGDNTMNIDLERGKEEILTIILPESKSDTFFFLKAVTEIDVKGTWLDPEGISNDEQAKNHKLQVEFSTDEEGLINNAIIVALKLINFLHVNEQILYTYLEKIDRSSLVSN